MFKIENKKYGGVWILESTYVKNLIMTVIEDSESDVWIAIALI